MAKKKEQEDHAGDMPDVFANIMNDENEQLQVVKELFTEEGLKMKTDLEDREVHGIAKLSFIADQFDIPSLNSWIDEFVKLRVSRKRKGRGEFIEAVKRQPSDMMPKVGFFGRKQI